VWRGAGPLYLEAECPVLIARLLPQPRRQTARHLQQHHHHTISPSALHRQSAPLHLEPPVMVDFMSGGPKSTLGVMIGGCFTGVRKGGGPARWASCAAWPRGAAHRPRPPVAAARESPRKCPARRTHCETPHYHRRRHIEDWHCNQCASINMCVNRQVILSTQGPSHKALGRLEAPTRYTNDRACSQSSYCPSQLLYQLVYAAPGHLAVGPTCSEPHSGAG
jgi:hypothetical protein